MSSTPVEPPAEGCAPGWWQRFGLSLPASLEAAYRAHQRRHAMAMYRVNTLIIFLLWLLLSVRFYKLMLADHLSVWVWLYGAVGVIVIMSAALSRVNALERWFTTYQCVVCFLAVGMSVATTAVLPASIPGQLTAAAVIFCMVTIYALAGLPFGMALLVGWGGGLAGGVLSLLLGGHLDRDILVLAYGGGSFLGMCLAYHNERHTRTLFMLQLENIEQLEKLSAEDPLTGLANRRHLDKVLDQEWHRAFRTQTPLAIMMIDLDQFKLYNDYYGHLKGDECITTIAKLIGGYARRPADIAARYGGDEFVLLLPGMDMQDALGAAERLLDDIRAARITQAPNASRAMVCVSIGVAVAVPFEHWKPEFLLDSADAAVYAAKHDGSDCCRVSGLRLSPSLRPVPSS